MAVAQYQSRAEPDGPELRFGFTGQHVEALAWRAVRGHTPSQGMDLSDRFEAAWGAVAERLYAAQEPPTATDLARAGLRGLDRLRDSALRERGYARRPGSSSRDPGAGAMTAGTFWRYWHVSPPPSPEEQATDSTALAQIMAALTPGHAQALTALAEHGGFEAAAAALGIPRATFRTRLFRAREAFLALWHEHETPTRTWRYSRHSRDRAPHGDPASPADQAATLATIAAAFGGQPVIGSADLLARLAAADPARYGGWDAWDLAGFLRPHSVHARIVGIHTDGQRHKRRGYRLTDITTAHAELTTGHTARQTA